MLIFGISILGGTVLSSSNTSQTGYRQPQQLVGREQEQAQLHEFLTNLLANCGSLMLIGGEAGIGKTTLVSALGREAAEQGALGSATTPGPFGVGRGCVVRSNPSDTPYDR